MDHAIIICELSNHASRNQPPAVIIIIYYNYYNKTVTAQSLIGTNISTPPNIVVFGGGRVISYRGNTKM